MTKPATQEKLYRFLFYAACDIFVITNLTLYFLLILLFGIYGHVQMFK